MYREYIVFNAIHDVSNRFVSKSMYISEVNYHNLFTSNTDRLTVITDLFECILALE